MTRRGTKAKIFSKHSKVKEEVESPVATICLRVARQKDFLPTTTKIFVFIRGESNLLNEFFQTIKSLKSRFAY